MPPAAAALLAGLLLLAAGGAAGSPATHRVRRDAALSLDAPALASADAAPDVGVSGGALPAGAGCAPARAEPTGREQRSGRAAPRQPGPLQRAPAGPRAGVGAEAAGAAGRGAGRTGAARPEPPAPHSQAAQRDGARGAPAGRRLTEYVELTNTTELPALAAIDRSCGRLVVVWCAVKQEGEGASVYDSYLKVSLLSVLAKAPSVVPVLLFDGAADHPLAVWVRDNGGIVIVHALSFKQHMMAAATELYLWQTTTWLATFSYFDIGLVVDELRARTQGLGVDLANVLYTDVDTIFMGDINACSLPAPRILAAAGEVTKLTPANAGVIYLNLTAWAELHGDLMRFAAGHGWIFPNADQEWLFSFFGDRVAVLPDTYNWKPYWGHPQPGTWGRAPAVKILHIHGPKFQESVCVLKYLDTYGLVDDSNSTLLAKIKGWCKYERSQYSMQLLLDANKVDGGRLYNEAHVLFYNYLAKARILGRPDEYWELVTGGARASTQAPRASTQAP